MVKRKKVISLEKDETEKGLSMHVLHEQSTSSRSKNGKPVERHRSGAGEGAISCFPLPFLKNRESQNETI